MSKADEVVFAISFRDESDLSMWCAAPWSAEVSGCMRVSDAPRPAAFVTRLGGMGERLHWLSSVIFTFEISPPKKLINRGLKKHSRVNSSNILLNMACNPSRRFSHARAFLNNNGALISGNVGIEHSILEWN